MRITESGFDFPLWTRKLKYNNILGVSTNDTNIWFKSSNQDVGRNCTTVGGLKTRHVGVECHAIFKKGPDQFNNG